MNATFAQRCLRRALFLYCLTGVLHALVAPTLLHDVDGAPLLLAAFGFLCGRIVAPILLLAGACELVIRRVDEFVTARWSRPVRR